MIIEETLSLTTMREVNPLSPMQFLFSRQIFVVGCFLLLLLATASGVVYCKHLTRGLHVQLQNLQQSRDKLHIEWSQLLLEQGVLGADVRVEKIAHEKLGMHLPASEKVRVIHP